MTRSFTAIVLLIVCAAAAWAGGRSQVAQVPGPGSGVVTVNGEVSISNRPFVAAAQDGEWRVSLAGTAPVTVTNTAAVTMAPPDVIRRGGRYEITWSGGEREIVTVAAIGEGAWVRIERTGVESRTRWVNLSMARAIVEAAAAK